MCGQIKHFLIQIRLSGLFFYERECLLRCNDSFFSAFAPSFFNARDLFSLDKLQNIFEAVPVYMRKERVLLSFFCSSSSSSSFLLNLSYRSKNAGRSVFARNMLPARPSTVCKFFPEFLLITQSMFRLFQGWTVMHPNRLLASSSF